MIKLGITGIIGSGKSIVSSILRILEVPVYNADVEAKRIMNTNKVVQNKIIKIFGSDSYTNNELNTKHLSAQIFGNESNRLLMNSIIHPTVKSDFVKWTSQQKTEFCAIESALIYEADFDNILDKIIMIESPINIIVQRITSRDNISKTEASKRIETQKFNLSKSLSPDYIIINDNANSLIIQCLSIIKKIKQNG
jgi:dephospho-CoA kinase